MSNTVEAISSAVPTPVVTTADARAAWPGDHGGSHTASTLKPDTENDGIAPAPIQPLSNRMLATFMQKDIELYGSMFGA
jgi:hypothetical protein